MPKGVPRTTQKVRTAIASVVDGHFSANEIIRLAKKIEKESGAKDAAWFWLNLVEYVAPKLSRIEHTGDNGGALSIEHILKDVAHKQSQEMIAHDPAPVLDVKFEHINEMENTDKKNAGD